MKKLKISLGALSICCYLFAILLLLGGGSNFFGVYSQNQQLEVNPNSEMVLVSENTIQKEYAFNDYFVLPEYEFSLNGQTETAEVMLFSPTDKAYSAKKLNLNEIGEWTLRFKAFENQYYKIPFTVYKPTFEVTSDMGSVTYTSHERFPNSGEGLVVNLPKDSSFVYNEVIDVSNATAYDKLIELSVFPTSIGTAEIGGLYIYLTDIYDSSNYLVFRFGNPNNRDPGAYPGWGTVTVSYTGAKHFMGCHNIYTKTNEQGEKYPVDGFWVDNLYYGTYIPFSYNGDAVKNWNSAVRGDPLTVLSLDYANKKVTSNSKLSTNEPLNQRLVANIGKTDYSDCILNGSAEGFVQPFAGFTTGECYLTIVGSDYSASSCNLFIKSILGANLSQKKSYDKHSPIVNVDLENYQSDNLPKALVNTPYKIFNVSAVDNLTSDVRVVTKVFLVDGNSRLSRYSLNNGYFTPNVEGTYEIIYSVTDGFGNVCERSLFVDAVSSLDKPIITLPTTYKKDYFVEETAIIPSVTTTSSSGVAKCDVKVLYNGKSVEIVNNSFKITSPGKYKIVYTATDYINQGTENSIEINATVSDNPILLQDINFPVGYVGGSTYSLHAPKAIWYDNGVRKECLPIVQVIDGTGTYQLDNYEYVPNANGVEEVVLKYIYECKTGKTEKTFTLPIINAVNFPADYKKFFILEGNVSIPESSIGEIRFDFSGDANVKFIKDVPIGDFSTEMRVYYNNSYAYNLADSFDITLTDIKDSSKYIVISIIKVSETKTNVSVNGGKEYEHSASFSNDSMFSVSYNNIYGYVGAKGLKIYLEEFADGSKFTGFSDNRAYVSFSAKNATDFRIILDTLCEQWFSEMDYDYDPPKVYIEGEVQSQWNINSTFVTNTAYSVDLIQENTVTKVSVQSPSGVKILNKVSADEPHEVTLNEYGVYRIIYTGYDFLGNSKNQTVNITVVDRVAPTLTLSMGDFKCAVNEKIKLPVASFSDNVTPSDKIECYLSYLDPTGKEFLIDDGDKENSIFPKYFTFNMEGVWRLKYMVFDENYNIAIQDIKVVVGKTVVQKEKPRNIEFIKDGESDYYILVPQTIENGELSGAYNIQSYIYKSTGYTLKIVSDNDSVNHTKNKFISLGNTDMYRQAGYNFDLSNYGDGFIIKEKDGNFYIMGGDKAKSYSYASYDFLYEAINLKHYYLTEVSFDYKKDINLPSIDIDIIPTFNNRSFYNVEISGCSSPAEYQDYIRFDEIKFSNIGNGHTFFKLLPPDVYYKDHKSWYTGTGVTDQLCWSQSDMIVEMTKVVIQNLKNNPSATHIMIGQNDGRNWCSCDACNKSLEKYGTNSAVLIKGLNIIAKAVQDYIDQNEPGRKVYVTTFSYTSTSQAPVVKNANTGKYEPMDNSVVLEPNIAVRIAPVDTDYSRSFYDEINSIYAEAIKGWSAICENICVWNYNTNFSFYFVPFCNWNTMQDNYYFFEENNVTGVMEQGAGSSKQIGWWECKIYVMSRLQWDKTLNVNTLINEFFENYYKDASKWMYKFFDEYRQWYNVIESKYSLVNGGIYARFGSVEDVFPLAVVERWQTYIDNAIKEIEYIKEIDETFYNELYRRIDKESLFIDYVKVVDYPTSFSDSELYSMRVAFKEKCLRHDLKLIREGGSLESTFKGWGI